MPRHRNFLAQGVIPAVVRPPLMNPGAAEIERIRQALIAAGLLADSAALRKVASLV